MVNGRKIKEEDILKIMEVHLKRDWVSKFWEGVYYFGIGTTILWMILKLTGVINTPLWANVVPSLGGIVIGLVGLHRQYTKEIRSLHVLTHVTATRCDYITTDIKEIKSDIKAMRKSSQETQIRLARIEHKLS